MTKSQPGRIRCMQMIVAGLTALAAAGAHGAELLNSDFEDQAGSRCYVAAKKSISAVSESIGVTSSPRSRGRGDSWLQGPPDLNPFLDFAAVLRNLRGDGPRCFH